MSSSTSRHRRGHAPNDSGISMRTKPGPDAAPTPPPSSSSSKQEFFICNRCVQPRAIHRRLPYQRTNLQLCDYCYQPKSLMEVRDASIIFEMKYCRQGGHEAPAINFKDDDNWSCCHCANRIASHPLKTPPSGRCKCGRTQSQIWTTRMEGKGPLQWRQHLASGCSSSSSIVIIVIILISYQTNDDSRRRGRRSSTILVLTDPEGILRTRLVLPRIYRPTIRKSVLLTWGTISSSPKPPRHYSDWIQTRS
ncbi:hypothetical protein PG996_002112 [Apiospora saccharicola]|uniref:Stc1 domain-containing protein n=1 Tax=Apiospora saccharicola TaxID=335842 RepID=A0ABR1WLI7_9PEZI